MNRDSVIVFVCQHGAAKSIIAAAYLNKLAGEMSLNLRAIARGTNPDQALSPQTVTGLHEDGLTPTESVPRELSLTEMESVQRIITFCELPGEYQQKAPMEFWEDVPPVSESYEQARNAIIERINHLLNK